MFELPECMVLARQMEQSLRGKRVAEASLGNSPHKFVWYNRTHEEFARLAQGKTIGTPVVRGRWLCVPFEPGYVLMFGELGGRILLHQPGDKLPAKYHLLLRFEDDAHLSTTVQMWGGLELFEEGQELQRDYVRGMLPTPVDEAFSREYFRQLVAQVAAGKKRSVKSLLVQEQTIPGLGNAIAQDIMFRAGLHPRRPVPSLTETEIDKLYDEITQTVHAIAEAGGRNDEVDLHGQPGGYTRQMDKHAAGNPCPRCGDTVVKIQYLGGACYLCPTCQK